MPREHRSPPLDLVKSWINPPKGRLSISPVSRALFIAASASASVACGRLQFDQRTAGADDALTPDTLDAPTTITIRAAGVWGASSDLRRTLATGGWQAKFTLATWYKSSSYGNLMFDAGIAANQHTEVLIGLTDGVPSLDQQEMSIYYEGGPDYGGSPFPYVDTWVHLVVAFDATAVNQADRVRWWVNGQSMSITSGPRMPFPENVLSYFGSSISHALGCKHDGAYHWSGSLAETYMVWGHALDASSFVVMTSTGLRSIAYSGPVTTESVYFNYEIAGQNQFAGQPDWAVNAVTNNLVDLPY